MRPGSTLTTGSSQCWRDKAAARRRRSIFGGFVRMHAGERGDGTDSAAEAVFPADHWDLACVIAVTVEGAKDVSSTDGMTHTEQTSPYFDAWIGQVEPAIERSIDAIRARDFDGLGAIAEASAMQMHACAIAADPAVLYWHGATVDVIHAVRRWRREGEPVFFTIDAGPHVKVFTKRSNADRLSARLVDCPGVIRTITTYPRHRRPRRLRSPLSELRAPGKTFWIGEYAVLKGATAVVAAVSRTVDVKFRPRVPGRTGRQLYAL